MDHARLSPSSSCDDLPDLINPEDIDKYSLTLNSVTWELATSSVAADEVACAWTRDASSTIHTTLYSAIRENMLQKYPGFKRTGTWKKSLLVYSKIKCKL
ncbi:hypothetical protein EXIGLDRAFT_833891 [Exidia glandulosa HHB12029]|uniref:Uncharacterized protein n=1 Tax=Exidia glandulosa HHB12029 TaxID=1314781 RepID=A0A165KC64_EXIGL|nr:hypothetical protein EXIGLDRAFT_833891 [Exidia glandulosa HHB12029]